MHHAPNGAVHTTHVLNGALQDDIKTISD